MRILILLVVVAAIFPTRLSAQPANTFFSTFDAERGSVVAAALGGNLWLGGQKDEQVLIAKLSPGGKILERHKVGFTGPGLDFENLVDLFEDGDGKLVGCGNFENDNAGRGFVFRYDPAARKMMWSQIINSGVNFLYGITELGPGGDFVLYGNPHTIAGNDAELLRLDRNTGQIVPGKAKRFGIGTSDNINQAVYHNGALYTCGRFTNDGNFSNPGRRRNALCKIDTATLEPVWSRISPLPSTALAQLYGRDLIIDDGALISTLSGDPTDPDLFSANVFLQKNDLNGNLLWVRRYDLPEWNGEFAEEVIGLPDGYLLYGHDLLSDTSRLFLLKTDKNGLPLHAVKINFDYNDEFPEIPARSKLIRLGDALFFTALSQNDLGQTQGILVKTDLNGWLGDSCAFLSPTAVQLVDQPAPVSELVVPAVSASPATLQSPSVSIDAPDLLLTKKCGAAGTCPNLPDLQISIDSITCKDGLSLLYYSVCNLGGQPYDGGVWLLLYDKNPLTDSVQSITLIVGSTSQPIPPGECFQGIPISSDVYTQNPYELDTFKKLYLLLGANFMVQTPIPLSGFPYAPGQPECSYLNNLDSIDVPQNLCGNCENPVTFVKVMGDSTQRETAYSTCKSFDGNFYLLAKRGARAMIAKTTALGQTIWTRSFPVNPNTPVEFSEIIEDSEQKLVLCGTEGGSPSNRQTIVMRYDPGADQVLWYRTYPGHRSAASGILEKSPGGNYILRCNSQQFEGGMLKTRSELLELNRATGDVLPGFATRYLGEPNIRLEAMVRGGNHLYAAGSRQTGPQQPVLPIFAKISAADGQPEWVQVTLPDAATDGQTLVSPNCMAIDQNLVVIAGTYDTDPGDPENKFALYLEKRDVSGALLWMKRYDIRLIPENVLMVPNAYLIFGITPNTNRWGMLKVDVHGNLLVAKTLEAAPPVSNFGYTPDRQGQMWLSNNDVVLFDHTQDGNGQGDLLFIRTDLNFGIDDACDGLQNIQLGVEAVSAVSQPVTVEVAPALTTAFTLAATFQADTLPSRQVCPQCVPSGCPDITFRVSSIFCAADSVLFYSANVCNTGSQTLNQAFEVTFYDKNPFSEPAQAVWSVTVNETLAPGECRELTWPLPAAAAQYAELYTLAGAGSAVVTPVHPDSFPFPQGFAECNYANNLDSFAVQTPVCDGCENPQTFFRTLGRVDRSELGYSLCAASDGNVYLAGRQGRNPMIAKMTPNGDMIWVRNFPAGTFLETVNLVEIFEDADKKLVLCGTEGASPNSRKAVAMRYDPDANQVLWFKQYPHLNPEALGIFEKTPGGNLILYGFSDELFSGWPSDYYKTRSELWEVDRMTGEVIPGLSALLTGNPSTYIQDMIPFNGSFYSVGSWGNDGAGRMLLAQFSASDGTPVWLQGTIPDTTQTTEFGIYTNILADDGQLVVLGGGILNLNAPDETRLVYLSKYAPNGSLLWMKGYKIPMAEQDMIAVPDGYVIFGRMEGRSYCMMKTDKDGNLLTVKKISLPLPPVFTVRYFRKNQILRLPNHLMMADDYRAPGVNDIVLIKTDYDFNIADSCSLLETLQIQAQIQPARTEFVFAAFEPYPVSAVNQQTAFLSDSINVKQWCPQCPCLDKPDITCRVDSVYCAAAGGIVANLQICNLGQVSAQAGFNLTFYDKNPLEEAATPLFAAFVPVQPGFGDCVQYTLPLNISLPQQTRIYTLAGLWSDVQTPIDPEDFPFPNGFAECNYANNLDSFEIKLPDPLAPKLGPDRSICAGETATLDAGSGYASYQWLNGPAAQTYSVSTAGAYTVEVTDGCGRTLRDTVQINVLPAPPPATVTITFYPGDTVMIDGKAYTQPDTVIQTLVSYLGCDSVVTNILQLVVTAVDVQCPADLTVTLPQSQTEAAVAYDLPVAATDCPDPAIALTRLLGPPSGGLFPAGTTTVCYEAANQCGIRDTCCFTVTAEQPNQPETACDLKTPAGCFRYELLGIRFDSLGQRRYRVRVANTCASSLQWVAIQLPGGVAAVSPKEGATYAAPGGNTYAVRNPNASPFYSIRFKPLSGALNNGASDIFEYTLPQQSAPAYIRVAAKASDGTYSEALLNTFNCPVQPYQPGQDAAPAAPRGTIPPDAALAVRPNPTTGRLMVDLRPWQEQQVLLRVLNAQGRLVFESRYVAEGDWLTLDLPEGLANGLYMLTAQTASGNAGVIRFVLER